MGRQDGAAISDLLEWAPPEVAVRFDPEVTRANTLSSRISKAVAAALKGCGKSRTAVVEAMRAELGDGFSLPMLEAYASEAKPHQITLERFMTLVQVTGAYELLGFVCEPFGYAVVPERYQDIIELHLLEEHTTEVELRKAALKAKRRGARR